MGEYPFQVVTHSNLVTPNQLKHMRFLAQSKGLCTDSIRSLAEWKFGKLPEQLTKHQASEVIRELNKLYEPPEPEPNPYNDYAD